MVGAGLVGGLLVAAIGIVFYGVMGWVMTAIVCALYNFVAGRIGGIRVMRRRGGSVPGRAGLRRPGLPGGLRRAGGRDAHLAGTRQPGAGRPAAHGGPMAPPPGWGQPGG